MGVVYVAVDTATMEVGNLVRMSLKWLIVLLLFALILAAWLLDGGMSDRRGTAFHSYLTAQVFSERA